MTRTLAAGTGEGELVNGREIAVGARDGVVGDRDGGGFAGLAGVYVYHRPRKVGSAPESGTLK